MEVISELVFEGGQERVLDNSPERERERERESLAGGEFERSLLKSHSHEYNDAENLDHG